MMKGRTIYVFVTIGGSDRCKLVFMKITILTITSIIGFALVVSASAEPKGVEPDPGKPVLPKITHENLYQMEELVKQGADPNAHYYLYPGLP
jgi:spore coat polysaccharide biosynthesis predicted glycosyltransferase SpsG